MSKKSRFEFIPWTVKSSSKSASFINLYEHIESQIDEIIKESREKSVALTKLEESAMWLNKAIRKEQLGEPVIEEKKKND